MRKIKQTSCFWCPDILVFPNSIENVLWVNYYHDKPFDMKIYAENDQMGKWIINICLNFFMTPMYEFSCGV